MAGNVLGKGYTAGIGMAIGTAFGRIAGVQAAAAPASLPLHPRSLNMQLFDPQAPGQLIPVLNLEESEVQRQMTCAMPVVIARASALYSRP